MAARGDPRRRGGRRNLCIVWPGIVFHQYKQPSAAFRARWQHRICAEMRRIVAAIVRQSSGSSQFIGGRACHCYRIAEQSSRLCRKASGSGSAVRSFRRRRRTRLYPLSACLGQKCLHLQRWKLSQRAYEFIKSHSGHSGHVMVLGKKYGQGVGSIEPSWVQTERIHGERHWVTRANA